MEITHHYNSTSCVIDTGVVGGLTAIVGVVVGHCSVLHFLQVVGRLQGNHRSAEGMELLDAKQASHTHYSHRRKRCFSS